MSIIMDQFHKHCSLNKMKQWSIKSIKVIVHLIRLRGLCRYSLIDTEYQVGQRSNWMKTRHTFGIILSSDSFSSDLFQVKYSPDLGISYHGVERSNITYSRYFELGFKFAKQHKPLLPWCSCHDELIWYSLDNDPREKSLWEIKDATDPSVSGIIKPHQHQNVQILYLTHNTRYIRILYLTMRHNTTNIRSVRTNIFLDITVPNQYNIINATHTTIIIYVRGYLRPQTPLPTYV